MGFHSFLTMGLCRLSPCHAALHLLAASLARTHMLLLCCTFFGSAAAVARSHTRDQGC